MPRARKPAARRTPSPRRARPAPTEAETRLLALAREVAAARETADAVRVVTAAYTPDGPLPRAVARAWLAGRADKTAALALAWAREQLRLGLEETLAGQRGPGRLGALSADTRAWLLLAGCEALAHEPPAAVSDRVRVLLELAGGAPAAPAPPR